MDNDPILPYVYIITCPELFCTSPRDSLRARAHATSVVQNLALEPWASRRHTEGYNAGPLKMHESARQRARGARYRAASPWAGRQSPGRPLGR